MTTLQQIDRTLAELARVKPHSRRRVVLESRLCMLRLKQIRAEIRNGKSRD